MTLLRRLRHGPRKPKDLDLGQLLLPAPISETSPQPHICVWSPFYSTVSTLVINYRSSDQLTIYELQRKSRQVKDSYEIAADPLLPRNNAFHPPLDSCVKIKVVNRSIC